MKIFQTEGKYEGVGTHHEFQVPIFSFVEDGGLHMLYGPSLDLTGYGKTEKEADESFEVALEELIKYTDNKKTLKKVLTGLSWNVKKKSKSVTRYEAPSLTTLLCRDEYLDEIFSTKDFNKSSTGIKLPA